MNGIFSHMNGKKGENGCDIKIGTAALSECDSPFF